MIATFVLPTFDMPWIFTMICCHPCPESIAAVTLERFMHVQQTNLKSGTEQPHAVSANQSLDRQIVHRKGANLKQFLACVALSSRSAITASASANDKCDSFQMKNCSLALNDMLRHACLLFVLCHIQTLVFVVRGQTKEHENWRRKSMFSFS